MAGAHEHTASENKGADANHLAPLLSLDTGRIVNALSPSPSFVTSLLELYVSVASQCCSEGTFAKRCLVDTMSLQTASNCAWR